MPGVLNGIGTLPSRSIATMPPSPSSLATFSSEAGFSGVNLLRGFSVVRIVSPLELIHENDEDEEL
jgi:hypothetical protein